jgi:predicted restriction endonuclease
VLEAAHIRPHAEEPDYRTSNGLLLRADLHTLFDLHLLSVNPQTGKISVAPELSETYRVFHNERISLPAEPDGAPDPVGLMQHFQSWLARNGQPTI